MWEYGCLCFEGYWLRSRHGNIEMLITRKIGSHRLHGGNSKAACCVRLAVYIYICRYIMILCVNVIMHGIDIFCQYHGTGTSSLKSSFQNATVSAIEQTHVTEYLGWTSKVEMCFVPGQWRQKIGQSSVHFNDIHMVPSTICPLFPQKHASGIRPCCKGLLPLRDVFYTSLTMAGRVCQRKKTSKMFTQLSWTTARSNLLVWYDDILLCLELNTVSYCCWLKSHTSRQHQIFRKQMDQGDTWNSSILLDSFCQIPTGCFWIVDPGLKLVNPIWSVYNPYHPCMADSPTFTIKIHHSCSTVGKYISPIWMVWVFATHSTCLHSSNSVAGRARGADGVRTRYHGERAERRGEYRIDQWLLKAVGGRCPVQFFLS